MIYTNHRSPTVLLLVVLCSILVFGPAVDAASRENNNDLVRRREETKAGKTAKKAKKEGKKNSKKKNGKKDKKSIDDIIDGNDPVVEPTLTDQDLSYVLAEFEKRDSGNNDDSLPIVGSYGGKVATSGGNRLTEGFSIVMKGRGSSPFRAIFPCKDSKDAYDESACIEQVNSSSGEAYEDTLVDKSSMESFLKTVVSAEGGSVGVQVSASVEYMSNSKLSTESVTYTIGGATVKTEEMVRNPGALKLTVPARKTLEENPKQFLQDYGLSYVSSIAYGGTFLGWFSLSSSSVVSQSSLKAAASVKYKGGVFSAEGSAEFETAMNTENSQLKVSNKWKARPEPDGVRERISEPKDLADTYTRWSEAFADAPVPVYLRVSNWYDCEEVQAVMQGIDFAKDDPVRAAFIEGVAVISSNTMQVATSEQVFTRFLKNTLETYLGFEEIKRYRNRQKNSLYNELQEFQREVESYYQVYTGRYFTDASLLQLDGQILEQSTYEEDIVKAGNRFGTWRLYSQPDGLLDHFETVLLPKIEEFLRKVRSYSCRPTGNNKVRYVPGENGLVNGFGDHNGENCPEYTVCVDGEDGPVEDVTKICRPVWRCEFTDQLPGNGKNCVEHENEPKTCVCGSSQYCCPNISPLDYLETNMCFEFNMGFGTAACERFK